MSVRFEGTFTALVTPFKDDGTIDWDAFDKLWKVQAGVYGNLPETLDTQTVDRALRGGS